MTNTIDPINSCIFMMRYKTEYVIINVYDNEIGTPEELSKAIDFLKIKFEIKDLRMSKLCLCIPIEYLKDDVLS
jgi:hypothetical protein